MNKPNPLAASTEVNFGKVAGGAIHPLTLGFDDLAVEAAFIRRVAPQNVLVNRWWMICAVFFMGLFGVVEYLVLSEGLARAWLIRYLLMVPMLLAVTLHTWHGTVSPFHNTVRILTVVFAHAATLFLLATTPPPDNLIYYLFGLMVIVYTQGFVFLRFAHATVIGWLAFVGYLSVTIVVNPSSIVDGMYQSMFLFFVTLTVTLNHYHQETYVRRDFRHSLSLSASLQRQEILAQRAEESNKAKSKFIAMMSHELRTPLNSIIGFSEMIKDELLGTIDNEQYKAYSTDIHSSGNQLLAIVNDILDIVKIEASNTTLQDDLIDLAHLAETTISLISSRPEAEGLTIMAESEGDLPGLQADTKVVKQVLLNLLSNAVKFTEEGTIIVRTAVLETGSMAITVTDTGIGIADEEIEKLTQPFYQVDSSLARKFEGAGLGLALAKSIMELHDGELMVESIEGEGTIVTCCFPPERVEAETTARGTVAEAVHHR